MSIGFIPRAEGLFLPRARQFYCASDAALAYIAQLDVVARRELFLHALEEVEGRGASVKHLSYLRSFNEELERRVNSLGKQRTAWILLRLNARKRFGSTKLLTQEFVRCESNPMGGIVSIDVESRRRVREQQSYHITLSSPFIRSLDDLQYVRFENGNDFETKHANRVNPLFPRKPEDEHYLSLSKHGDVFFSSQLIGFTRYAALLEARTLPAPQDTRVFAPFDFRANPALAYELLVRLCAPAGIRATKNNFVRHSTFEADSFLEGRSDFVTSDYREAIRTGIGNRAVLLKNRVLPDGAAYVMYAMFEYCLDNGWEYRGMSRLFGGTPNETIAVRFAPPIARPSLNVYVVLDDKIPGPALLYADSASDHLTNYRVHELQGPLRERLNASASFLHKTGGMKKMFVMNGPRGERAIGTLFRANNHVFDQAGEYARPFGWSVGDLIREYSRRLKL